MSRKLTILLLFIFFAVPVSAGTTPQFSFTDINGKVYRSDDLKGSPLVINVGAHW